MTALSYKIPIGGSWMCDEAVDEPTQPIEPIEEECQNGGKSTSAAAISEMRLGVGSWRV